jgi:phosphatidylserine decarboxylase
MEITQLPSDLVIYIRDFLVDVPSFIEEVSNPGIDARMMDFIRREAQWSLNNFLSMSNSKDWKYIREDIMIWTLNWCESERYVRVASFRDFLKLQKNNSKQLRCQFPKIKYNTDLFDLLTKPLLDCSIDFISINGTSQGFPATLAFPSVRSFSLSNCREEITLGNCPQLMALQIANCPKLVSVGSFDRLESLSLKKISPESFRLFSFSFATLTSLSIAGLTAAFLANISSFRCLTKLSVDNRENKEEFPHLLRLPFPELLSLTVKSFLSIDVSGLKKLRSLNVGGCSNVIGKEEIYSQLSSLAGLKNAFENDNIANYPNLRSFKYDSIPVSLLSQLNESMNNSPEIEVSSTFQEETFVVKERLRSLTSELRIKNIEGIQAGRYFHKAVIQCIDWNQIWMFRNSQVVHLSYCFSILDFSPLAEVPYLTIHGSAHNKPDLSCLGKQRYLELSYCYHVTNEAIDQFGNIPFLKLDSCLGFTEAKNLLNNKFLSFENCSLAELYLTGKDYHHVHISSCHLLKKVILSGSVYSLSVDNAAELTLSISMGNNCKHLISIE